MTYSEACCSLPPVVSNYEKTGTVVDYESLPIYTIGPQDAKKAVLVFYDIFGFHPNAFQFCDILAKHSGWRVILPDFFRGDYCTPELFANRSEFLKWIGDKGSLEAITPDFHIAEKYLKEQGADAAALVGFCWGAKMAVQLNATHPFFVGSSLIHPSFLDNGDAENAEAPILAIPSQDEFDMTEFFNILSKKPFGNKCKHIRFDDVQHGFAASRGDYDDPLYAKRANQAIKLTADFFSSLLDIDKKPSV